MKSNIGTTDKFIRLLLALIIGVTGIFFVSWWGLLAIVPLLTGAISFCPVYKIFGISTCTTRKV